MVGNHPLASITSRRWRVFWFFAFFAWAFAVSSAYADTTVNVTGACASSVNFPACDTFNFNRTGVSRSSYKAELCAAFTGQENISGSYKYVMTECGPSFTTPPETANATGTALGRYNSNRFHHPSGVAAGTTTDSLGWLIDYTVTAVVPDDPDADGDGVPDSSDQCLGDDTSTDYSSSFPILAFLWAGQARGSDGDSDTVANCNDTCDNNAVNGSHCGAFPFDAQAGYASDLHDQICIETGSPTIPLSVWFHLNGVQNVSDPAYPFERSYHFSGHSCTVGDQFPSLGQDTDGDGTPDNEDPCPADATDACPAGDPDGDGVTNATDPCPTDAADACPAGDPDGDGQTNENDPCPNDATNQCDSDGDGIIDTEDECPQDPTNTCNSDSDGDGTPDETDPCPQDATDSCTPVDTDGDGTPDYQDPCDDDPTDMCPEGDPDGDGQANAVDPCNNDATNSCGNDPSAQNVNVVNVPTVRLADDGGFDTPQLDQSVPGFQQIVQDFFQAIDTVPLIASVKALALPAFSGQCPLFSIDIPFISSQPISTTKHCELADANRAIIKALMLFVFTIMGVRIVVSA